MVTRHGNVFCHFQKSLPRRVFRSSKNSMPLDDDEDLSWEWHRLMLKHVVPERDSTAGLVQDLKFLEFVESGNFKSPIFRVSPEHHWLYLQMASEIKERIIRPCRQRDRGFVRRLLDAVIEAKPRSLTVTGFAVAAWGPLYEELGGRPNRWQLRERVEEIRGARVSDKQWGDTLKELGVLVP